MQTINVVIARYTNTRGDVVHQPHLNGQPLTPETTDADAAFMHAQNVYDEQRAPATFKSWDGDTGTLTLLMSRGI